MNKYLDEVSEVALTLFGIGLLVFSVGLVLLTGWLIGLGFGIASTGLIVKVTMQHSINKDIESLKAEVVKFNSKNIDN